MSIFRNTVIFIVYCLLILCCIGCNGTPENRNSGNEPVENKDKATASDIDYKIKIDTIEEKIDQKREEKTVPETDDIQILSNICNQINRPTGQVHYYDGNTLFQMEDGVYLSYDYGQTMTKIFDDIRVFTYQENVYILRNDGIYLSDYEGQRWEKLSEYTPDMVAEDIYPGTGYDAHVDFVFENKLFFRMGVPDEYGGLYSMDSDGTNVKELISRVSRELINDSYWDTLLQYSYWCTKDGIYYSDYATGLYRIDYDGQNRELVIEMAKISNCIVYSNIIYFYTLPYSAVYAYDIERKSTRKLFDEEAVLINITPQGLVLRTYEPQKAIAIYSFTTKQVEIIMNDYYWAIFVAGAKIFGYGDWKTENANEYVLLK